MSIDTVFRVLGPTTLVTNAAGVQITPSGSGIGSTISYRISNLAASRQYIAWGNSAVASPTAPSGNGGQVTQAVGIGASATLTLELSAGVYFIAGTATGFEITPGSGTTVN